MKIYTLARLEAARPSRFGFALAALCLLCCASVSASGQEASATPASASSASVDAARVAAKAAERAEAGPTGATTATPQAPAGAGVKKLDAALKKELDAALESEVPELGRDASPVSPKPAPSPDASDDADAARDAPKERFGWKPATEQALLFLGVQHGYALTQPKTRRDLAGPFFRDYFRSVGSLGKWEDGGRFFTNYLAHPMQGSLVGYIWVQNDPRGRSATFGRSKAYWRSRLKAAAWTAAWSTQFEIGLVSQASIGNVGLHGKQTWIDLVVTPTGGAAWLIVEDALDRFVIRRLEGKTDNRLVRIGARMLLNPTRTGANLLRFKKPWHRDR